MSRERSFSFGRDDDTSHQAYRGAAGYQASGGASYLPEPSRDPSSIPYSSIPTPPSHSYPQSQSAMLSLNSSTGQNRQRQPDLESQTAGYPMPTQGTDQRKLSAYRTQRQEEAAASGRRSPRKPLPTPPNADTQTHSAPIPPVYTRSQSPPKQPVYGQASSYSNGQQGGQRGISPERAYLDPSSGGRPHQSSSYSSQLGLAAAAAAAVPVASAMEYGGGRGFTDDLRPSPVPSPAPSPYRDNVNQNDSANGYFRHSRQDLGNIEPSEIDDDDDEPLSSISKRKAAGVGAAGLVAGGAGGFLKSLGSRDASGSYGAVAGGSGDKEKPSDWLRQQTTGNKKLKWMVGGLIVLVIVLAVIGGVVGAVLSKHSSSSSSSSSSSHAGKVPTSGNLNKQSPAIARLMNNKRLHKVFPGIDYSPLNAQYPACLTNPPLQNNITADIAVLSQLTPIVRLYGTDCQQTEMVLNAIKDLGLEKSMKLWAGIYLDSNSTTNSRQTSQMYDVLDKYGADQLEGIIVGNEVLFSQYMSEEELISKMDGVRSNLRKRGLTSLKVATSDLGSAWTSTLAAATDVVMANVHPFFGGVAAPQAASWTYTYWQGHDVILTDGTNKGNIIAETGWPSAGGNYCTDPQGGNITCTSNTQGSVAGISEMNTFLEGWVCKSLERGTNYFWFEAFDEPWKVIFNSKNEHWESKWGLMDVNRVLKPGVVIPDCGGTTAALSS